MIKNLVIPAGETIPIVGVIKRFAVVQSPVALNIRAGSEPFSSYVQQLGEQLATAVNLLEVQNPAKVDIVCQIFYDAESELIDNRSLPSPQQPNVVFQNGGAFQWPDQTGSIITDPSGNQWYAVQRLLLSIQWFGGGYTASVCTGLLASPGLLLLSLPAAPVWPPWSTDARGPFCLVATGGNPPGPFCFSYEIYQGIPIQLPTA